MKIFITLLFCATILHAHSDDAHGAKKKLVSGTAYFIDSVQLKGKRMFAYVKVTGNTSVLWFRKTYNKISKGDMAIASISFAKKTFEEMEKTFCEGYTLYDEAKTITGCAATAGAVFCATEIPAAVATGMTPEVEECEVEWEEAISSGEIAECVNGIAEKVAEKIDASKEFGEYSKQYHLNSAQTLKVANDAIKEWCRDIEGKSERETSHQAKEIGKVFSSGVENKSPAPVHGGGGDRPPARNPGNQSPTHPGAFPGTIGSGGGQPSNPSPSTGGVHSSGPDNGYPRHLDPVPNDPNNDYEGEGGGTIHDGNISFQPLLFKLLEGDTILQAEHRLLTRLDSNTSSIPDSIVIKKNTARLIAKAYLFKTFGKERIDKQRPFKQEYIDKQWIITGSPHKSGHTGFKIVIDAATGEITDVSN